MLTTITRSVPSEAYAHCAYLYVTIKWLRSVSIKQMMINHLRGTHISSQLTKAYNQQPTTVILQVVSSTWW